MPTRSCAPNGRNWAEPADGRRADTRPVRAAPLARQVAWVFGGLAVAGVLAVLLASSLFARIGLTAQQVDAAGRLRMLTQSIVLALHRVPDGGAVAVDGVRALLGEFDARLREATDPAASPADPAAGGDARLRGEWLAFRDAAHAFLDRHPAGGGDRELPALEVAAQALLRATESKVSDLVQAYGRAGRGAAVGVYGALFAGLLIVAAAALWGWLRVFDPLRMLAEVAERHADGDWSARAGYVGRDEVGRVASALDQQAGALEGLADVAADRAAQLESVERSLRHQRTHEAVTGLPNRVLLLDRLTQTVALAHRRGRQVGVLHIDLDHFRYLNDSLGQDVGNQLLRRVAGRLSHCVREHDTVACLGGDEFVVVLSDHGDIDEVDAVTRRVAAALAEPAEIAGHAVTAEGSIGVSVFPRDADAPAALLVAAELAMLQAKQDGGNTWHFHTPDLQQRFATRRALESALRQAVGQDQFVLHYQPQIDARSGALTGVEALIRWRHPSLGLVAPGNFITLAEETGLIVPIGYWAARRAAADWAAWTQSGRAPVAISLNLSARQFRDASLADRLTAILAEAGVDPGTITLELTESVVMQEPDAALAILRRLKSAGLRLSLDDFGTGYSSFAYLRRLPIDELKIDRSFVADLDRCPQAAAIVESIIGLAHALGKQVVVEGVETEAQWQVARRFDCDVGQGYLFGAPVEFLAPRTCPGGGAPY